MAVLNAQNSSVPFYMSAAGHVVADVPLAGSSTAFDWRTVGVPLSSGDPPTPSRVNAIGTGFTYDASLNPTAGTVSNVSIDLLGDAAIDVVISMGGANVVGGLPSLFPTAGTAAEKAQRFWSSILSGNDTLIGSTLGNGDMTGDFFQVVSTFANTQNLIGGNDAMSANSLNQQPLQLSRGGGIEALCGDAFWVHGTVAGQFLVEATLTGGRDDIRLSGFAGVSAVGDALIVGDYGFLIGGADTIVSNVTGAPGIPTFSFSAPLLIGDAFEVGTEGIARGGADSITGSNYAFLPDGITGDVQNSYGHVTGGRDVILGRAGQDRIAGDVFRVYAGFLAGGSDVIRGGEDSDILSGDIYQVTRFSSTSGDPVINFTGGNDTINGDNGNDLIAGDILDGSAAASSQVRYGNDTLFGNDGDDQLYGDGLLSISALALPIGGNDILDGGLGDDFLDGQDGNDTAAFNSILSAVNVNLATGLATGQGIDSLTGIENAIGSALNDGLRGNAAANLFTGGLGNDLIDGDAGSDTASYAEKLQSVSVSLNGAIFAPVFVNGVIEDQIRNIENITGGAGNDTIFGDALANTLNGGAGNDFLQGRGGPDTMDGGLGVDTASFADSLFAIQVQLAGGIVALVNNSGGGNEDYVRNIENITGGIGGDTIAGDAAVNALNGGNGDDLIRGGAANDRLDGGLGYDTLDYSDKPFTVVVSLNTVNPVTVAVNGVVEDTISGFEHIRGGNNADTLTGDLNANRLEGGLGNDILRGEANNDVLIGGFGVDRLTGGLGVDRFQFVQLTPGADIITDFLHLTDDIVVSAAAFGGGLAAGGLAANRLVANATPSATQAFGQFLYETDTGILTWDQNGIALGGQFQIAQLLPAPLLPSLSTLDFVIIA